MRHLRGLAAIEVSLLPGGMVSPPRLSLLVAAAGAALGLDAPQLAAPVAAVHVAVVAPTAEKEHLPAATADHEA
jgi:hypothetical protein